MNNKFQRILSKGQDLLKKVTEKNKSATGIFVNHPKTQTAMKTAKDYCDDKDNGISQDHKKATKWLTLAASQGHEGGVEGRDNLIIRMTAEQIEEAQRRAKAFVERKQTGS